MAMTLRKGAMAMLKPQVGVGFYGFHDLHHFRLANNRDLVYNLQRRPRPEKPLSATFYGSIIAE
jgi:hypothetical protein